MRILAVLVFVLSNTAAFADEAYVCSSSGMDFTETLKISGSGTAAQVHLVDPTLTADLAYNEQMTQELAQGGMSGYWAFAGSGTSIVSSPPTTAEVVFLIEPAVVSGGTGSLLRFSDDAFITFACVPTF
jgi:hypothetical protein